MQEALHRQLLNKKTTYLFALSTVGEWQSTSVDCYTRTVTSKRLSTQWFEHVFFQNKNKPLSGSRVWIHAAKHCPDRQSRPKMSSFILCNSCLFISLLTCLKLKVQCVLWENHTCTSGTFSQSYSSKNMVYKNMAYKNMDYKNMVYKSN